MSLCLATSKGVYAVGVSSRETVQVMEPEGSLVGMKTSFSKVSPIASKALPGPTQHRFAFRFRLGTPVRFQDPIWT